MLSVNEHYKDRNPLDTVQIIRKFFESNGYDIKLFTVSSPVGVESCHIDLYKDGHYIARSNGKGMTKDYALASGFGELYERFCGKHDMYSMTPLCSFLEEATYSKYGYYYDPNEKIVTSINDLTFPNNLKEHFVTFLGNNEKVLNKYIEYKTNNHFVEVPFTNVFNSSENIYLNLPLLFHLSASNGLAAGNNFYEAFNQGASELMERFCLSKFADLNDKYYTIDIDSIQNKDLKKMLIKMEEDNNHCIILDLSYTYGLPVIGLATINKATLNTSLVFGCFPIFDIALERCITETYQNYSSFSEKTAVLQQPLIHDEVSFREQLFSFPDQTIFPVEIFKKCEHRDGYNKNAFLTARNYSNKEIYLWILNKLQENNISLFYRNISLSNEIYAIHLYSYEMSGATDIKDNLKESFNDAVILEALNDLQELNSNYRLYCNNNQPDYLFKIINFYYKKINNKDYDVLTQCLGHHIPFLPLFVSWDQYYFLNILISIFENGAFSLNEQDLIYLHSLSNIKEFFSIKKELIFYTTFVKYIQSFQTLEDIVQIFAYMNIDFDVKKEFENIMSNNTYFLQSTFFKLCNSDYNSLLLKLYEPMIIKEENDIES